MLRMLEIARYIIHISLNILKFLKAAMRKRSKEYEWPENVYDNSSFFTFLLFF